jgi:hypothetical protein
MYELARTLFGRDAIIGWGDDSQEDGFVFDPDAPEVAAEMQRRLADRAGSISWEQLRAE